MSAIQLVCLDFDGTFMVYDEPPGFMHPAVVETLNALGDRGLSWCTNSGRDVGSQIEILSLSKRRGLRHMPVAALAGEALIFTRADGGFEALEPWNARARKLLQEFHGGLQARLRPGLPGLIERHEPTHIYMGDAVTAFFVPDEEGRPDRLGEEVGEHLAGTGGRWSLNGGWVIGIPQGLDKGVILCEFAEHVGMPLESILAIGDHMNDVSMLDGQSARHVGCPADAQPEVQATVRSAGGYVASEAGPLGTAEVLQHYL
jgi:hydroxymethylpyrimidine pyrophosphatase-like HAD family hydrolase